jgi:signal transduction histidine kinase
MAHDLKNPLAAISGAADFLLEEQKQGRSIDESVEFVALIHDQSKRLEKVINDYRRLARVEAHPTRTDLRSMLERVFEAQKVAAETAGGITVALEVADDLGEANVDPDLLTTALENLVRNASEAIRDAKSNGRIVIVGARVDGRIHLVVKDDGPGMDARTREQALGGFFTTKTGGSGLGLANASRVAEAHGGELVLDSLEGAGTTVTLVLHP